jgi:hypothetical protein
MIKKFVVINSITKEYWSGNYFDNFSKRSYKMWNGIGHVKSAITNAAKYGLRRDGTAELTAEERITNFLEENVIYQILVDIPNETFCLIPIKIKTDQAGSWAKDQALPTEELLTESKWKYKESTKNVNPSTKSSIP